VHKYLHSDSKKYTLDTSLKSIIKSDPKRAPVAGMNPLSFQCPVKTDEAVSTYCSDSLKSIEKSIIFTGGGERI
jgi:hypothetical protein